MAKTYYLQFGTSADSRQYFGLAPTFLIFNNNGTPVTPPSISAVTGATGFYSFTYGTTTPIVFLADAATTSPGTSGRYVSGAIDPNDRADEYGNTLIAYGLSSIALGTTGVALGISGIAQGNSAIALGNTSISYGVLNLAQGSTIVAQNTNEGITLVAIGNTVAALGVVSLGSTLVAIGNSLAAIGGLIGDTSSSFGSTAIDPTTVFGFLKRSLEINEGNQTYTKSTGVLDLFTRGATLLREKTVSDTSTQTTKS